MKILVTGGAGFIGSNFIRYMLKNYPSYRIVNVDLLTYAGNLDNLKDIKNNKNYKFVKGDIRERKFITELFNRYDFDVVINFAAESHVDRSIENPEVFLTTNIIGTQVLLDIAKSNWKKKPEDKYDFEYRENVKFIQISTDEVYGDIENGGFFTEETPLAPNSPYSSSKASADLIVRAYHETYQMPVNITRCSNNYGPFQFPEKLIPLMINNALNNKDLPVYGDGQQIRDWLHVYDHSSGIATVLEKGKIGEVYNIGGNNEYTNLQIIYILLDKLDKSKDLIKFVKDRPGHDRRYAIDNTKITEQLGWKPEFTFEEGIEETIQWYLNNEKWTTNILNKNYQTYYN